MSKAETGSSSFVEFSSPLKSDWRRELVDSLHAQAKAVDHQLHQPRSEFSRRIIKTEKFLALDLETKLSTPC